MFSLKLDEKSEKSQASCENLYAPISGKIFKIEEVSDSVFSRKIMGDGFAVALTDNRIFAPVTGTVTLVQRHAVGLIRPDGLEVLLYLTLDKSVSSERPYKFTVRAGDTIDGGEEIGRVDSAAAASADSEKTVMIVFTNTADKLTDFAVDYCEAFGGTVIGSASAKQ